MIKSVGTTAIRDRHTATCHCGAVELEVHLPNGLVDVRRCNCSLCRRKGALMASVPLADLKVIRGADVLRLYEFHTRTAKHYFCSTCGIYTHHRQRSDPNLYGFNVACLEGVNPFDIGPVPASDGVNHPSDRGAI